MPATDLRPHEPPHAPEGFTRRVFGGDVAGTGDDLVDLLERADVAALPPLYAYAGSDESVWDGNLRFRDEAARLGAAFGPGTHEWGHWDDKIQDVLCWLPLPS